MPSFRHPSDDEYAPYYATYTRRVPADGDVMAILAAQPAHLDRLLALAGDRGDHRYAEGKWSVKEVLGHLADAERVFVYRALAFSRRAAGEIPGMDQDEWMAAAGFAERTLEDVAAELRTVRAATLALFSSFPDEALSRRGVASGVEFTVNAIPYIVAGHWTHHWGILEERYLL